MTRRIGIVGIHGGWSSLRLQSAFANAGCQAHLVELSRVAAELDRGRLMYGDLDLRTLDAVVIKKIGLNYSHQLLDRLALLRYLAEKGVLVLSTPSSIRHAIDRLSCTLTLQCNDVPIPPTVVTERPDLAVEAIQRFGGAVLKPLYTSKARGMMLVDGASTAHTAVERFQADGNRMFYVQKWLELPGRDLGLVFIGGEYLGCYARVAGNGSWNTTIRAGGRYEPFDPPEALIELARKAQAPFDLAFTCVDIAETGSGPFVFEVSAFGGFRGLWESQRIDAAAEYARYVLERMDRDESKPESQVHDRPAAETVPARVLDQFEV